MKRLDFIKRSQGGHWVGDGFPVRSVFSYNDLATELSPFLLLDHAGPVTFEPTSRKRGVGEHPHRGFETVTIVYAGGVSHRDSSGGGGSIGPGDVQWMTAGSGLVHEEFHSDGYRATGGPFEMIQLWVNLPASDKMAAPGYQGITDADIPQVSLPNDAGMARIIAGNHGNSQGPARTFTDMNVWDLRLRAGHSLSLDLPEGHTAALYVLSGALHLEEQTLAAGELAVFGRAGRALAFSTSEDAVVLLLSGEPINEPVAGQGPFVMNTRTELVRAYADFNSGAFGTIAPATR